MEQTVNDCNDCETKGQYQEIALKVSAIDAKQKLLIWLFSGVSVVVILGAIPYFNHRMTLADKTLSDNFIVLLEKVNTVNTVIIKKSSMHDNGVAVAEDNIAFLRSNCCSEIEP